MCTFQRRDLVCEAIRALGAIDYDGAVELIVVIDGSTDGTLDALGEVSTPFPITLIAQENEGLARARNRGVAAAKNDIILFLDDDLICRPDILTQHARSIAAGADAVLGHIPLDPQSSPGFLARGVGEWAEERAQRLAGGAQPTLFDLVCGHMSIRRRVFEAIGGFDQQFTEGGAFGDEDLDLGTRLTENFAVRFNAEAVASQRYVVTPAQNMEQWYQAGGADVAFARKHPARARELFDLHGARRLRTRFLFQPLSRLPFLPRLLAKVATRLAAHERFLRRMAAWLFYAAREVLYWNGVRHAGGMPKRQRVLILCYHSIQDLKGDPVLAEYGVSAEIFARQLDSLLERGFSFVSPDEVAELLHGRGRVPPKALLLTFDDCYEELAETADSLLQPRGIPAIAFAVSDTCSNTNEWDQAIGAREMRLLDGDGLRLLRTRGVEIGCHSRSHRPLPGLSNDDLVVETRGSAEQIAALGLPTPRFFAYPHGQQDDRSRAAVRDAGFCAAFGLSSRWAGPASDRFFVPRIEILASDGPLRFWLKTRWPRLSLFLIYAAAIPRRAKRKLVRTVSRALATEQVWSKP
jgi:peptidoglycan/xylan/chitin deacetylase (PgdA/CDA1 family)/glycosyltransferase involved in cell wall biosynthesis